MTGPEYPSTSRTSRQPSPAGKRSVRRYGIAGLSLAAAVALIGAPIAQAGSLPSALLQAAQAMATAHSYKMTMDTTTSGAYPSSSHFVAVFIRTGKSLSFDVKDTNTITIGKAPKSTTFEMVLEGSRLCTKGLTGASWNCSTNTALASTFASMGDLSKIATATGTKYTVRAIGQKTVQSQNCTGFLFTSTSATSTDSGMVWVSTASHFLVEEDLNTSTVISKGAKPTPGTLKMVVSNYNDPNLSIPKV